MLLANGPSEGPCTLSSDTCGYIWMGAMGQALALLPVPLVALLITGFVVGVSSRDAGLAFGAVLVGITLTPLAAAAVAVIPAAVATGGDVAFRIASNLAGAVLIGLVLLIPIAPGFGLGRVLRPRPRIHRTRLIRGDRLRVPTTIPEQGPAEPDRPGRT